MTRDDLKILMMERCCPTHEIRKLEHEFWNLQMQGAKHTGYTNRLKETSTYFARHGSPRIKEDSKVYQGIGPRSKGIINLVKYRTMHGVVARSNAVTYVMVRHRMLTMPGE